MAVADPVHGKASTYGRHGCRCDPCRQAATDYRRAQRQKHRGQRERDRLQSEAWAEATKLLRAEHADEFARIYQAERLARGLSTENPDAAVLDRLLAESTPAFDVMRNELRACGLDLPPVDSLGTNP